MFGGGSCAPTAAAVTTGVSIGDGRDTGDSHTVGEDCGCSNGLGFPGDTAAQSERVVPFPAGF